MSKDNGGPAFPRPFSKEGNFTDSKIYRGQDGMSLRDYYAAHAPITLQDAIWAMQQVGETVKTGEELITFFAQLRLAYADAMLKEREK